MGREVRPGTAGWIPDGSVAAGSSRGGFQSIAVGASIIHGPVVDISTRPQNYVGNYLVRTPGGAWCFRVFFARFVVFFKRCCSIVVGCGRRGIQSTYMQERADVRRDCAFHGGFELILRFWEDGMRGSTISS